MKFIKTYIVDEASAAPILDNTERSGIAADHSGMCRFDRKDSPGFRTVVAALKRHCDKAPRVVKTRNRQVEADLGAQRWHEARELLRNTSDSAWPSYLESNESPSGRRGLREDAHLIGMEDR